jgi:hypothetical protein
VPTVIRADESLGSAFCGNHVNQVGTLKEAWIPSTDFGMNFAPSAREAALAKTYDQQPALIALQGR